MIGLNHYRAMSLCLLATVFLVACTRRQQFWASPTVREIEEVKSRTVPRMVRCSASRDRSETRPVSARTGRFRRGLTTKHTFNGSRISSARSIT